MLCFHNFISCSFALALFLPTLDIKSFHDSQIVHLTKMELQFFTSTFRWCFFLKRLIKDFFNDYFSIELQSTRQSTNKLNTLDSLSFMFTIANICKSPIPFIWWGITSTHLIINIWHIYAGLHIFSFIHYFMFIDNYWDLVSSIINFFFPNNCSFFLNFPIFLQLISQLFLVMSEFFSSKIQHPGVKKKGLQIIKGDFLGKKWAHMAIFRQSWMNNLPNNHFITRLVVMGKTST